MDLAGTSLLEVVTEGKSVILVARLESPRAAAGDPDVDSGTVGVAVVRELTGKRWHGPDRFEVKYARFKQPVHRAKEAFGWNAVEPKAGALVILGLDEFPEDWKQRPQPPAPVAARSVTGIKSVDDPLV